MRKDEIIGLVGPSWFFDVHSARANQANEFVDLNFKNTYTLCNWCTTG